MSYKVSSALFSRRKKYALVVLKIISFGLAIFFTVKRAVPSFGKMQNFLMKLREDIGKKEFDEPKNFIEITYVLCTNTISNIYQYMIIRFIDKLATLVL